MSKLTFGDNAHGDCGDKEKSSNPRKFDVPIIGAKDDFDD